MRPSLRRALAVALVAAATVAPGAARADLPVVASGSAAGPSWAALKVLSAGSTVRFDFVVRELRTPNFLEIFKYDANDRFLGGFGVGAVRREGGVFIEANGPTGVGVRQDVSFARGVAVMEWSPDVYTLDGVTKILIWSSGGQDGWTWALRGGSDVSVEAITEGTGSYAFMSNDMVGTADVRAHDPVFPAYGARASVERSKTIEVKNKLIGFYVGGNSIPPVTNNVLTLSGPDGTELCYPGCDFATYVGGKRPGTYVFGLRAGMGVVWSGNDDILAVAVDARLPA